MEPCANSTPGFKKQRRKLSGSDILKCRCQNCAATSHKTWECPEGKNITPDIVCEHCGNAGHPTFDCKVDLKVLIKCCNGTSVAMVQVLKWCNGAGWKGRSWERRCCEGCKPPGGNDGPGVSAHLPLLSIIFRCGTISGTSMYFFKLYLSKCTRLMHFLSFAS